MPIHDGNLRLPKMRDRAEVERKAAGRKPQRPRDDRRALAARLVEIREEERGRIARELHDELGQQLTGLKMRLAALSLPPASSRRQRTPLQGQVAELSALIDQSVATVRRISTEMRPAILDHLGLRGGIEWLADDFSRRSGIACRLSWQAPELSVSPAVALSLFRIAQEALTNAARHSQARHVTVRLTAENGGGLSLEIADDGIGLPARQPSGAGGRLRLGLLGIGERATALGGSADVSSGLAGGTVVRVGIPLATPSPPMNRAVS
jgi:two-component system sensor kinase